jgi:hypothetical protein
MGPLQPSRTRISSLPVQYFPTNDAAHSKDGHNRCESGLEHIQLPMRNTRMKSGMLFKDHEETHLISRSSTSSSIAFVLMRYLARGGGEEKCPPKRQVAKGLSSAFPPVRIP